MLTWSDPDRSSNGPRKIAIETYMYWSNPSAERASNCKPTYDIMDLGPYAP